LQDDKLGHSEHTASMYGIGQILLMGKLVEEHLQLVLHSVVRVLPWYSIQWYTRSQQKVAALVLKLAGHNRSTDVLTDVEL